jgi:pyruvate/2-oxoglutarate dehydrogenase complex dihydrolipoamide acyltransferase (E2) component
MPGIELHPYSKPAMWRKMAIANWRQPADPQIYGRMEVDMGPALEYAKRESERAGISITVTHLLLRASALCLKKYPDANAVIRWNRIYTRKRIHVFCQVAIPGRKPDLLGVLLRDADTKDPAMIARELQEKATAIRNGTDRELLRTLRRLDKIPGFLYGALLRFLGFFQYTLNLDLSRFGIPADPFGGAAVTNIGTFGIAEGFAPLPPITRLPIIVSVGKIEEKPVVREGQIVIRPMCVLCATFDHRVMDGYLVGRVTRFVARYLADPEKYERKQCLAVEPAVTAQKNITIE